MPWLDLARAEREDFAAFLESLSPEQWEAPTLCERGMFVKSPRTRSASTNWIAASWSAVSKGRLMVDRINQVGVDDYADRTPEQLVALIRTHAEPHGMTAGFGGRVALTDNMIHQQDIRRPLGIPRTIPAERLRARWTFPIRPRRSAGHGGRVVCGSGDRQRLVARRRASEVHGTGEALLMAMAGRSRRAEGPLPGPGKAKLDAAGMPGRTDRPGLFRTRVFGTSTTRHPSGSSKRQSASWSGRPVGIVRASYRFMSCRREPLHRVVHLRIVVKVENEKIVAGRSGTGLPSTCEVNSR